MAIHADLEAFQFCVMRCSMCVRQMQSLLCMLQINLAFLCNSRHVTVRYKGTVYAFIIIGRHSIPGFWSEVLLHACIAIQVNIAVLHTSAAVQLLGIIANFHVVHDPRLDLIKPLNLNTT